MESDVRLVPDQVNISLVRSWIGYCEDHGSSCSRRGLGFVFGRDRTPLDLILIDVHENMLVRRHLSVEGSTRYLALSYVWGDVKIFQTLKSNFGSLQQPGALLQPHAMLPQVFRDAIQLTKMLGERFLWVDALCIIQDDPMK
jgi:hypothetical protein